MVERSLTTTTGHSLANYRALFDSDSTASTLIVSPVDAVRNSLVIATTAAAIAVVVGALASMAVVYDRGRWRRGFEVAWMAPLGVSAVTLGFGFLIALATPPLNLRTSWWIVPLAQALIGVPFVMRTMIPALRTVDQRQRDAAVMLGAAPATVYRYVDWPIAKRALTVGAVFAFAIALGEFGATSFLARPDTPTVPVAMFRLLGRPGGNLRNMAMALGVILAGIVVASSLVIERLRTRDATSL